MNKQKTILIVEDDDNDISLLQRAFRKTNREYKTQVIADGSEAIAYIKGEHPFSDREQYPMPAVILLDLNMRRTSGFEVLDWVRNKATHLKNVPVIVLTSSRQIEDVERAYRLGANSYLAKSTAQYDGLLQILQPFMDASALAD